MGKVSKKNNTNTRVNNSIQVDFKNISTEIEYTENIFTKSGIK